MRNRFSNAAEIWGVGASNPRGVARALVEAIDEACEEGQGSDGANDPAVHLILDHLCSLVGLPQPTLAPFYTGLHATLEAVRAKAGDAAKYL